MKSSTARNHFNRARDAMLSAYSTARALSLPHKSLMEYTARARSFLPKTAPRWMHEALAEIDRTLLHVLHTRHVLWAFPPRPHQAAQIVGRVDRRGTPRRVRSPGHRLPFLA